MVSEVEPFMVSDSSCLSWGTEGSEVEGSRTIYGERSRTMVKEKARLYMEEMNMRRFHPLNRFVWVCRNFYKSYIYVIICFSICCDQIRKNMRKKFKKQTHETHESHEAHKLLWSDGSWTPASKSRGIGGTDVPVHGESVQDEPVWGTRMVLHHQALALTSPAKGRGDEVQHRRIGWILIPRYLKIG
jgi:hypothetical protein